MPDDLFVFCLGGSVLVIKAADAAEADRFLRQAFRGLDDRGRPMPAPVFAGRFADLPCGVVVDVTG